MRILICGASGFLGRHLVSGLRDAGHEVVRGVRIATQPGDIEIDYLKDTSPERWLPRLQDLDAVINAVGVLRDSTLQPMDKLQAKTPCALFSACAAANIPRVVHVSALGVESGLDTAYFRTRREAEACLMALPETTRWLNLRPSLIYGEDGASAKMFRLLARLPLHILPMGGHQAMQPVHIDDIVDAVRNWLDDAAAQNLCINAAGAEATTLRGMLDSYRNQLGYSPAVHVTTPACLIRLAARIGNHVPASPLCSDTLSMLEAGNTGSTNELAKLLGRQPESYRQFINT